MPNAAGVNNIDRATVLPSSTPVLLHFSDQFAQHEAQKQAQELADQKAEDARQIALAKYEGGALDPKNFDPSLQPELDASLKTLAEAHKQKKTIPEIMNIADNLSAGLAFKSKKIKEAQLGVAKQVAGYMKNDPYADPVALTTGALKNALSNGGQFDETKDYIAPVIKDLGGNLYHPQATGKAQEDFFKNAKTVDVEEPATYNDNGSLKTPGFKAKLPDLVKVNTDKEGNVIYKNGKASYSVPGENYRLPGGDHDYADADGKPVKVVPQSVFDEVYKNHPAMMAPIENKVRQVLETPVKTKQGDVQMGPDSDYADMLRKKFTYDFLNEQTSGKYPLNPQDDKSFQNQNAVARLKLAQANHSLSSARFSYQKTKDEKKDVTVTDINPLTFQIADERGVDIVDGDNPDKLQRIVYAKYIGDKEGDIILGTHKNIEGDKEANVYPYKSTNGLPYYKVLPNGDWEGLDSKDEKTANPKIIPTDQVKNEQLKYLSKDDLPASSYVKPVTKKDSPIKRAAKAIKNAFTPKPKPEKEKLTW